MSIVKHYNVIVWISAQILAGNDMNFFTAAGFIK